MLGRGFAGRGAEAGAGAGRGVGCEKVPDVGIGRGLGRGAGATLGRGAAGDTLGRGAGATLGRGADGIGDTLGRGDGAALGRGAGAGEPPDEELEPGFGRCASRSSANANTSARQARTVGMRIVFMGSRSDGEGARASN